MNNFILKCFLLTTVGLGLSSCAKKSGTANSNDLNNAAVTPPAPPPAKVVPPEAIPIPDLMPVKDIYSHAVGTANLGNTCFANATHKLLLSYFKDQLPEESVDGDFSKLQILFFDFMQNLRNRLKSTLDDPEGAKKRKFPTDYFKATLNYIFDEMEEEIEAATGSKEIGDAKLRKDQMDAQEYFAILSVLLSLEKEMPSFHTSTQMIFHPSGHKNKIATEADEDGNLVNKIFLFLNIAPTNKTMADVLNFNASEEFTKTTGDRRTKDDGSKKIEDGTENRYLTLDAGSKPPKRMILGLKRFAFDKATKKPSKIEQEVESTQDIEIPFHSMDLSTITNQKYKFQAVVVHTGTLSGGHYVTYAKEGDTWFLHDDKKITLIEKPEAVAEMNTNIAKNGYMFLYEAEATL